MATEYCPQCGTARIGALRFCRSCAFDYDTLPPPQVIAPSMAETLVGSEPVATPGIPVALPASSGSSRRGWLILGGVIFAAVVAAAAFIGLNNSGALTPHHNVTGSFELSDTNPDFSGISTTGSSCKGTSGYADIVPGTNVTIKDGEGKILATGSLGEGSGGGSHCTFSFTLAAVPEAPFYTIEVGHRGALNYSLADMQGFGWQLSLTLGS